MALKAMQSHLAAHGASSPKHVSASSELRLRNAVWSLTSHSSQLFLLGLGAFPFRPNSVVSCGGGTVPFRRRLLGKRSVETGDGLAWCHGLRAPWLMVSWGPECALSAFVLHQ